MSDLGWYRRLYVRLWRTPAFLALSRNEKLVALYVLLGPQTNRIGLFLFSIETAAGDLQLAQAALRRAITKICQRFEWGFDGTARVIYVPSWWVWNPPANPNVLKGSLKDLDAIPPCALREQFLGNLALLPEAVRRTLPETLQRTVSGTVPETLSETVPRTVPTSVAVAVAVAKTDQRDSSKPHAASPRSSLSSPARDPFTDPEVTRRAAHFVERYQELYPAHRHGARYAMRPARDYAAAIDLCETWVDDARLEKLAICFLTTDHKFAAEGSRTIPQFLALASWCDGELAEWEQRQARA